MYPKISHFINELLGTDICLPIQSFGFFMAMAFVVAFFIVSSEYRRMTALGIFPKWKTTETQGGPLKMSEVYFNALFWAVIGYKLFLMFDGYQNFCDDPQSAILSLKGSFPGALLLGGLAGGFKYYQYQKRKNDKAEEVIVEKSLADEMGTIFTIAFIVGVVGAKIFHNLEYLDEFMNDPVGQLLSFSGLTFYGGLLSAGVALLYYVNKRGYQLLPFVDGASMILILGYGIGRIGCQVSGDGDWGIVNNNPKPDWLSWLPDKLWAYDYPHNVLKNGIPIEGCGGHWGEYCTRLAEPVFPTPIYETAMAFMIFGILWLLRKRLPYWGQLASIYLVFNGIERFLIEKIRVNPGQFAEGAFTQAEIISSVLILMGVGLFVVTTFVWKKNLSNTQIKPVHPPKKDKSKG
jgi:phosphatidylglycerol:prolipoprotein diacylglycerol transferase